MEQKKKQKISKIVREIVVDLSIVILAMWICPNIASGYSVKGTSMVNSLADKDRLFAENLSYKFADPKRFDIVVVYPFEHDKKERYVKRVIGLPGETIEIKDDTIYINGEELEDKYKAEPMNPQQVGPITLGEDEYFVLGDNRNHSDDSRKSFIGPVPKSRIISHVLFRIYPLDDVEILW